MRFFFRIDRIQNEIVLNVQKNVIYHKTQISKRVKNINMKIYYFDFFIRLYVKNINNFFDNVFRKIYEKNYEFYNVINLNTYILQ